MKNLHNINSILKVKNLAADPAGADESGLIYFNTTTNAFRVYDGTAWAAVTIAGSIDLSSYFKKDGSVVATGAFQLGGFKITGMADPTAAQDAATKNYTDTAITTATANYIPLSQKGANNGVATLDAGGKVPVAQLPSSVMTYEGTWNASTNTPTLANGIGDAGMVYIVSVAGSTNFGAGSITFAVGDWAVYNGTIWQRSLNSNAVVSVNGQTGVVSLTTTDVAEGTNLYFTNARGIASTLTGYTSGAGVVTAADSILSAIQKLNGNIAAIPAAPVSSVFGRTGAVVAVSGDYTTSQVTEASNLYFTNARVIAAPITGYVSGAGIVADTDSVLQAIQKLNGNIAAIPTGANTSLSNLSATAVNVDLLPTSDATINLGTWSSKRWLNFSVINNYAQNLFVHNGTTLKGYVSDGSALVASITVDATRLGSSITNVALITEGISSATASKSVFLATGDNVGAGGTGDIRLITGAPTSGTRGSVSINALNVNMNSSKIINLTDPTAAQDAASKNYVDVALALKASLASPTFTGTPSAPTAAPATSTTQIATTAFVVGELGSYLKRDGTVTITGVLVPNADNARNLGSTTAAFATGYVNIVKANDSSNIINLSTGIMTSSGGFDTVNWQARKLVSGTVTAASWGNGGLDMYDTTFSVARDVVGLGKIDLVSGANLKNMSMSSNRAASIAAAGTATITLPTATGAIVMYKAFRSAGGTETKTGTLHIAKETAGSNTNSSISETSTATNVSIDSVVFSISASGALLITNNTAYAVDVRASLFSMT